LILFYENIILFVDRRRRTTLTQNTLCRKQNRYIASWFSVRVSGLAKRGSWGTEPPPPEIVRKLKVYFHGQWKLLQIQICITVYGNRNLELRNYYSKLKLMEDPTWTYSAFKHINSPSPLLKKKSWVPSTIYIYAY